MKYLYGANSDIGNSRKLQEDYIFCKEYGDDLLTIVADGSGTQDDRLQPAVLCVNSIISSIDRAKESNLFEQNISYFIKNAMLEANNALGILKIANEEIYFGYAASCSLLYLTSDGKMYYAHAGNTRIYLMRGGNLIQLTEDHTVAQEKLDDGKINNEQYYITTDRLSLTNGLGLSAEPVIYVNEGRIKDNDIILMTSDGVHYAIRPEFITSIVLESENPISAAENLVKSSKDIVQYPDNISAIVIVGQN